MSDFADLIANANASRKRASTNDGGPNAKRQAVDDEEKAPENILAYQNKHMKKTLSEKSAELAEVRQRLEKNAAEKDRLQTSLVTLHQMLKTNLNDLRAAFPSISSSQSKDRKQQQQQHQSPEWLSLLTGDVKLNESVTSLIHESTELVNAIKVEYNNERAAKEKVLEQFKTNTDIDPKLTTLLAQNEKLTREINSRKKQVELLQSQLHQSDAEKTNLEQQVEKYRSELDELSEKHDKSERRHAKTIEELKEKLENAKNNSSAPTGLQSPAISRDPSRSDLAGMAQSTVNNMLASPLPSSAHLNLSQLIPNNQTFNTNTTTTTTTTSSQPLSIDEEELRRIAEKRLQRIDELENERTKLRSELLDLKRRIDNPQDVKHIKFVRDLESELNQLRRLKDAIEKTLDNRTVEFDEVLKSQQDRFRLFESAELKRRDELETRVRNAESRVAEFQVKNEQMNGEVSKLSLLQKPSQAVIEMEKIAAIQKKELVKFKELYEKAKEEISRLQNEIQRRNQNANNATEKLSMAEIEDMKIKINDFEMMEEEHKEKQVDWEKRERQLRSTIETLQNSSKDTRDLQSIKIKEKLLSDEVEELKKQVKELQEKVEKTKTSSAPSTSELDELRKQLKSKETANQALMAEVESVSLGFVELEEQNSRLVKQLSDKEDRIAQIMGEQIRVQQLQQRLRDESQLLNEKIKKLEERITIQTETISKADTKSNTLNDQIRRLRDENVAALNATEQLRRNVRDQQEKTNKLANELESTKMQLQKELQRTNDELKRADSADKRSSKLSEEVERLSSTVRRLTGQTTAIDVDDTDKQKKLLDQAKTKMICGVCNDREKDAIITRCWHVFCYPCLKRNLEVRNRKCPRCSVHFGDGDVKQIWI